MIVSVALSLALSDAPRASAARTLVGSWRYEDPQIGIVPSDSTACGTDFGISYAANGSFNGYDEAGEWRVDGDRLVETVWEPEIASGLTPRAVDPEVRRFRLEWLSDDVINLRGDGNADSTLIRCP